jgi:hypothetical protein
MLLARRLEYISRSPELDLTAASFPAQTKRITIPSTAPIEEIRVTVQVTVNAAESTWRAFGPLSILKKVTLNVTPNSGSYDQVSASGASLLALADNEGLSLSRGTRAALLYANAGHVSLATAAVPTPAGTILRMTYRIPIPHPALTGMLRVLSLLDCINHRQDPVLTLEFAAAAEFTGTANPFTAASCEVVVVRRDMPDSVNTQLLDKFGYIRSDIRDTNYDVALSTTGVEKRFALPSPGDYMTAVLLMLGGTAAGVLTPMDLSATTAVGSETQWRLEAGGNPQMTFRMKHLQEDNDYCKSVHPISQMIAVGSWINNTNLGVTNAAAALANSKGTSGAPNFGGALAAGHGVQDPAIVAFDFLTDGLTDAGELGSVLNANFKTDAIKWELVGSVTTPASQASTFQIISRRFKDSVERFKNFPAAA